VIREAGESSAPEVTLSSPNFSHCFDLDRILEEPEQELRQSGKLEAFANRGETVKRVNFAFGSALEDGSKAEDFRDLLQELGGNRVRSRKAYGDHCVTLWVTKPS
jgi:hypothetical protein